MKKFIALLVTLTLLLGLCACGKSSDDSSTQEDTTTSESSEADASESEAESVQTDETDATVQESAEMQEGDTGDGPADLNAGLVTFTLPEGYSYEAYTYYIDEDDPLFGSIQINISETDSYDTLINVDATTQTMASNYDEAIQTTIDLCNLDTYEDGKYTINDTVTYGDYTYTPINISTEWYDSTYFVTYVENGNSYNSGGLLIRIIVDNKKLASDDPLVKTILESLVVVTE